MAPSMFTTASQAMEESFYALARLTGSFIDDIFGLQDDVQVELAKDKIIFNEVILSLCFNLVSSLVSPMLNGLTFVCHLTICELKSPSSSLSKSSGIPPSS